MPTVTPPVLGRPSMSPVMAASLQSKSRTKGRGFLLQMATAGMGSDWRVCATASSRWEGNSRWKYKWVAAPDCGRHFKLPTRERNRHDRVRLPSRTIRHFSSGFRSYSLTTSILLALRSNVRDRRDEPGDHSGMRFEESNYALGSGAGPHKYLRHGGCGVWTQPRSTLSTLRGD